MKTATTSRRYAIVGTGAVGGFYGARLQNAGLDVHFLLHHDYEHVRQHGLQLDSIDGNIRLPCVNAYDKAADMPPVPPKISIARQLIDWFVARQIGDGATITEWTFKA